MSFTRSNRSEQPRITAARSLALGTVAGSLLAAGCASRSAPPSASTGGVSPVTPVTQVRPQLRIEPNEAEANRLADARAAADSEDYDTALRIFRELLQDNPTLAPAYTGIGEVLENKGEIELAEPAYARAVSLDPTDFTAMSGHGRVLEALGRSKEAIRALQRALTIRPRDLASNLAMSRLLLLSDQTDGAIAFAERAIRVDPASGPAHLALARAYSKAGRGPEAIREYETACELIDPPVDVMFALVNAYAAEKRYREAANAAEALTRTAPSAAAYERLGWSLFRLNEFDASDTAYRKSIELDPAYWPALNGVGVNALNNWIKNGKNPDDPLRDEARAMLQRSLRANGDQPKVAALLLKYRL
jgi:tetratricopeptide (TPR) repeat protein